MIALGLPDLSDAKAALMQICKKNAWATPHEASWNLAYDAYISAHGNPHIIEPAKFNPKISDDQYALYDKRKSGGPIRRIRDFGGLLCCPMCGSGSTGHVDHYLPRSVYPEFSVFTANLVPACQHCNTSEKGEIYKGASPRRFIHPYFDTIANDVLWWVNFIPPFDAVTFGFRIAEKLVDLDAARVQFHLENILGRQFRLTMTTSWSAFVRHISNNNLFDDQNLVAEILHLLAFSETSKGLNSWDSAFLRGLSVDANARIWMRTKASTVAGPALMPLRPRK